MLHQFGSRSAQSSRTSSENRNQLRDQFIKSKTVEHIREMLVPVLRLVPISYSWFLSCDWFLFLTAGSCLATGSYFLQLVPVLRLVLLAEPLGSLAFKMVQVRQLESEQKVKLESAAGWVRATQNYHLLSQHKQLLKDQNTEKQQLGATNSTSAILPYLTQQRALNNTRQGLNTYPNELGRHANRLHKGDVLANLSSSTQASRRGINRSAFTRGVQRYNSRSLRSYLPSAIEEDKIHRQLQLSQLVSRSHLNLASDKSLRQNSDHLNQTTSERATVAVGHVTRYSQLNY
ncbi:hypothetical protein F511_44080 [Dorcoceras hygrometricum]|uniref:Uncharacterized protein n=1 Tax=Dorcoceras hygrometricum TaxID=472368 RepID=A0A2Z6ZYB1_9LAMI|nr:hypothetical protein F511_44080 [Dorcoceras hygrometricum]